MTKAEQTEINVYVFNAYNAFDETYWMEIKHSFKRLRSCQAWVHETDRYIYLVSYKTIVAFIDKATCELFDVLRMVYGYTSTSTHHISKFKSDYKNHFNVCYTWRDL